MSKTTILLAFSTFSLISCVTTQGIYSVDAYDTNGEKLNKINISAQGSGIYSARNALCKNFPKATIVIRDFKSNAELKSESPYQCR